LPRLELDRIESFAVGEREPKVAEDFSTRIDCTPGATEEIHSLQLSRTQEVFAAAYSIPFTLVVQQVRTLKAIHD